MQTAMRVLPTVKADEALALLSQNKAEKLEAELQKRLNAIAGTFDDGAPRVRIHIEDRSRGRMPYVRTVPYGLRADTMTDFLDIFEIVWGNFRSVCSDMDTLMNQIRSQRCFETEERALLKLTKDLLAAYDLPVRIERSFGFAEGHARADWHVWRRRREPGDNFSKNSQSPKDRMKLLKAFVRESARWLRRKYGKQIREWVLYASEYRYTLYALVEMTKDEIAKAQAEAEISRRLRHAEKMKLEMEKPTEKIGTTLTAATVAEQMKKAGVKKWRKPRKYTQIEVRVGPQKKLTPRQEAGV
jgi:hypothetical protein